MKEINTVVENVILGMEETGITFTTHEVVESSMYSLGIDTTGERFDRILYTDPEGGIYPTLAGKFLIKAVQSADWTTPAEYRRPSRPPEEGERKIVFGDPLVAIFGVVPFVQRIDCETVDLIHRTVCEVVNTKIREVIEQKASQRKDWGRRMNASLKEAGCTPTQVQAWWGMQWKKEVSPTEWVRLLGELSPDQVAYGLEATGHRYLAACGIDLGRSFPRSMDIVVALAKAHDVKPKHLPKEALRKKEGVDLPPSKVEGGTMVWSF